ncbi:hypothetical protein BCV70DRAFT_213714 [Testicularia cyperi]|uniref:Uncharacterized protein n=1 Tax=Testicularia cyperi TaxID=1882483 RepID=A0A317XHF9_9BASI|nr:hypothetical protein BCV70DRAFT_213714 [Testicularia cyperi]
MAGSPHIANMQAASLQAIGSQPTQAQNAFHIQQQQQPSPVQQQQFVTDPSYQHNIQRSFQQLPQDPSSSSQGIQYRVPSVTRAVTGFNYSPYPTHDTSQQQPHHHHQQQQLQGVPVSSQPPQQGYSTLTYSSLNPPPSSHPFASYGPDYAADYAMMSSAGSAPMMRYGSYGGFSSEDMSRAGSSSSGQIPMTQQDIDNLLAMSRAQAKNGGDATAFPCTYCDKVYTGKHARSIWRRHLQDKHNIPLSAQPRRTRWDGDANRPKNAEERRARMLESKRRWARKKRLQEKQAAQANKSGASNTPAAETDDEDDMDDDGMDADISTMSASFGGPSGAGDDTFSVLQDGASQSNILGARRTSTKSSNGFGLSSEHMQNDRPALFAMPNVKAEDESRPTKRQAMGKENADSMANQSAAHCGPYGSVYPPGPPHMSTSGPYGTHTLAAASHMYSTSPMRRAAFQNGPASGLTIGPLSPSGMRGGPIDVAYRGHPGAYPPNMGPNESFSSSSSEYSQPNSASFLNDSFGGRTSNSGSESANTSIGTPNSATLPVLPLLDGYSGAAAGLVSEKPVEASSNILPPMQKGDTREAAIQLLALRSNSNSPTDSREAGSYHRRLSSGEDADGDEAGAGPWNSTPSRTRPTARSEHSALAALSRSQQSPRPQAAPAGARDGGDTAESGAPMSPTPTTRTLAAGSAAVRSATAGGSTVLPLATPGPPVRAIENPFSLDKHKISPYGGRRKLSYSAGAGVQGSPSGSSSHLASIGMDRSLSSTSSLAGTATGSMGPKLPPLVSTPIRPLSHVGASAADAAARETPRERLESGGDPAKPDSLPSLASASKKNAAMVSTPFSKPSSASTSSMAATAGLSVLRRSVAGGSSSGLGAGAPGSSMRPTPSKHLLDDQFSSPQHLNLTESLGLAPHSISRTSSFTPSTFYASSLGLTPSVAAGVGASGGGVGSGFGVMSMTPFHNSIGGGLGSFSGFGGFTPLSAGKMMGGVGGPGAGGLGGVGWPDSVRRSTSKGGLGMGMGMGASPSVIQSFNRSISQPVTSSLSSASGTAGSSSRLDRRLSTSRTSKKLDLAAKRKADIFDTDLSPSSSPSNSINGRKANERAEDEDEDDDDDDDENMLLPGLETPSKLPFAPRKGLAKTTSANSASSLSATAAADKRTPLGGLVLNSSG